MPPTFKMPLRGERLRRPLSNRMPTPMPAASSSNQEVWRVRSRGALDWPACSAASRPRRPPRARRRPERRHHRRNKSPPRRHHRRLLRPCPVPPCRVRTGPTECRSLSWPTGPRSPKRWPWPRICPFPKGLPSFRTERMVFPEIRSPTRPGALRGCKANRERFWGRPIVAASFPLTRLWIIFTRRLSARSSYYVAMSRRPPSRCRYVRRTTPSWPVRASPARPRRESDGKAGKTVSEGPWTAPWPSGCAVSSAIRSAS